MVRFAIVALVAIGSGCSQRSESVDGERRIQIVDYSRVQDAIMEAPSIIDGPGEYENWESFHSTLVNVLEQHGAVGSDPDQVLDVYHSLDWFDELRDGFALISKRAVSRQCLLALHEAIAKHHDNCTVVLTGIEGDVTGVEIFISSSVILVGWYSESESGCKRQLAEAGIKL